MAIKESKDEHTVESFVPRSFGVEHSASPELNIEAATKAIDVPRAKKNGALVGGYIAPGSPSTQSNGGQKPLARQDSGAP